jgi:hypothetical protein
MSKKNILITVSGGRTSAFMAIYLKELYNKENLLFLYANTGKERPETIEFLNRLDTHFNLGIVWLEAKVNPTKGKGTTYKIVDYDTCSKNGEPFTDVIDKYGLPSKLFRHCTRELKEQPIHKYAKEIFGKDYLTAMGIRADEKHRLAQKKNYIYPLAEMNVDKKFINDWWKRQPFNLQLHEHEGNCDFCFLKSKRKRVQLLSEGLNVDWWNDIEKKYAIDRQPMMDVRNGVTIEDLIKINNDRIMQLSLLDDTGFDCYCKAN